MVTRVDKYLGGLGIDATGKLEVTDNAAVVVGNGSTTGNVYAGTINSGGVELRANDYATLLSARSNDFNTYSVVLGGLTGANTAITNLQTGLTGTNTNLSGNVAIFNGAFTGSNTRLSGAESNVIALQGGLSGTNTNLSGNVAIFNGAFTGSNTRLSGAESNVASLQGGISGTNTNLSGNVAIFTGAFTGSNTRLSGAESNVESLQGGLSGANTAILNLQTGLSGTNTNLSGNVAIFVGAHTGSNTRISGAESNVASLQGGISGTNTNLSGNVAIFTGAHTGSNTRISGAESNVASLQGGLAGTNTNLSGNVAIFTGAFTGSNTRLAGAESNVESLQGGLSGANTINSTQATAITNLTTGLTGANTNISAITSSPVIFQSNVTILGNLTLAGNTTIVTSNTISFGDTLLSLGANNTVSDNLDIGLYGHYWNGTANSHSGIFRSAVSKDWMLFANYIIDLEGNSTVTISNSSFQLGTLRLANANAGFNVSAANAILGTSVYSGAVELRANDYATYLMALGGLTGANTNLSGNVAIFTGAFTGSNTRLAGAESNVIALQGGLSGANTINTNQTTGLTGANTNITALTGGLTGANTNITALTGGLAGANTNITALTGGLAGANTNITNLTSGLTGANTNITNLTSGLTGANTAIALRALAASPTFTGNATFDTSTLFVDSINDRVGIGTVSPGYLLDVRGTANVGALTATGTVTLGSNTNVKITGGTNGQVLATDGSGNLSYVGVLTAASPTFTGNATFDTNTLFVDSLNDRVGVGTVSPSAKIHLVDENNAGWRYEQYNTADGTNFRNYRARGTIASPTAVQSGDRLGSFLGAGYGVTGGFSGPNGGMSIWAAETFSVSNAGTYLTFATSATGTNPGGGGTEAMRIDSNARILIGSTATITGSAASKVQVFGSGNNASIQFCKTDLPTSGGSLVGIDAYAYDGNVNVVGSTINFRAAENWTSTNHGTDIQFRTTPIGSGAALTESMRITANGSVGIGTSSPGYLLDVRGTANVGALTTSGTVTLGSNTNVKITGGSSGQYLQTDGSGNLSYVTVQGVPVASIIMYGANTAPSGWLVCDGTAVSRSTYSGLFAVISNVFGIGDNSTTFNLPDFRGRSPHGVDASQSITIGGTSAGKINISYQNSSGTGTTGTGTTGTSTTGTSATAITATTSNASTTVASATSTGTTAGGSGSIPAATYSTGSGTGTIPAATYSTGTGTTAGGTTGGSTSGTGTTGTGTTGTGTSGSGGPTTHTLTTIAYQLPVLVKDQSPNSLVSGVTDHTAHTHTIPGLAVPGLSVPGLSIPGLSVPGLSVPALSIPAMNVSVPGLTIPAITVTIPGLSIPALTIPSLTVNTHTHNVPALTIPGLSIPGLSIPGLSVPALTVTHPATIVQFIIKT